MNVLAVSWYKDVLIAAGAIVTIGAAVGYLTSWGRGVLRGALALRSRRAQRQAVAPATAEPSPAQVRILNAVHEHFRTYGRRAVFRELDKQLDLQGVKLRPLAESMPRGLLLPNVASRGGFFRDDDELVVTREGLRHCDRGQEALDLLARSLAYLAKREKPFVPTTAEPELMVTDVEIGKDLRLTPTQLEQVWLMIDDYEWQAYTRSSRAENGSWDVSVKLEHVRRFRGIRDGEQYLRVIAGESFEHQLNAEEAVPRFTLICDIPESLDLDSDPVELRIENDGPSDTFEATVLEVTNALQAPSPWHIRWHGTADQTKEILSDAHWVLDIARGDPLHMSDGHWTPSFVFLQPNDMEVLVTPKGLGATPSRYGLPMRVKIRVTPRSQPQRFLENVVTLWFTGQGRHVLWDQHRVPLD